MNKFIILLVVLVFALIPKNVSGGFCPDYDHDRIVTLADAQAVADRFGTYPGSPPNSGSGLHYAAKYDLNSDRAISIGDVLIVALQIGEEC